MTTLYVKEQGSVVGRRGERLVISKGGAVLEEVPIANINQVALMGNVQLTSQAVATLLAREVEVLFLSSYGKYRGRLSGSGSGNARLRHRQLQTLNEEGTRLAIAKAVVDGKINNQRVLLQRQRRRNAALGPQDSGSAKGPVDPQRFDRALAGMMRMRGAGAETTTIDSVRGYEGKAAAYYFDAVRAMLEPGWRFERREYYPPPDPFNALLSFGYSLLQKDVFAAVNQVGFDPYLGFFHELEYGRPSLALDLMEEWRPVVVDALALELVNRGSLRPEQFEWTGSLKRPVQLGEAGTDLVLRAYGERLETPVYHADAGRGGNTSVRKAIVLQAYRLARVIMGREAQYVPYLIR
jgi:CRISPR-associated protein Cas1